MNERKRRVNLVLDAALTAGCAGCAVRSLCQSLLEAEGVLSAVLWLAAGLGWLVCSGLWMAHIDHGSGNRPGAGKPLKN